jgi:hypothetical protein
VAIPLTARLAELRPTSRIALAVPARVYQCLSSRVGTPLIAQRGVGLQGLQLLA